MKTTKPTRTTRTTTLPTNNLIIQIDTREQQPWNFASIEAAIPYSIVHGKLDEGDYATERPRGLGFAPIDRHLCCVIERKSLADIYATATHGRERFETELERIRAAHYGYAALVIEADWTMLCQPNAHLTHPTQACQRSLTASLFAWSQRFNLHLFTCPGREVAERVAFRILERWYRDGTTASNTPAIAGKDT